MGNGSDPFADISRYARQFWSVSKWGYQAGRNWRASRTRKDIEAEFGPEVGAAVEQAIRDGKNPGPILERARKARAEQAERERQLLDPPPIHGSARWATTDQLEGLLRPRAAFDTPSSILLGAYRAPSPAMPGAGARGLSEALADGEPRFVHVDEDGHLLTIAPTRSGKAVTTIIPNLLRYRGSCIVLDPKGELYDATSKWRAAHVGPVYRWAPFDLSGYGKPRHGFNPLARVRSQFEARSLAEQLFPRDPRAPEFFSEDAAAFVTALILYVLHDAPPEHRNLAVVHKLASLPTDDFSGLVARMKGSSVAAVRDAAVNVLGKSADRGLPNLRDTLYSKFARWGTEEVLASLRRHDLDFEALKDRPATIYLDVPFELMQPYAPVIRMTLKAALDAMARNRTKPAIPVLFVLDEFLQLGPFPEFRDAIRTHAGMGVKLWFFLQDIAGIQEHYPNAWQPFFNCSVRQFFGIDDPDTAEVVGRFLGTSTVAYRVTNTGSNTSAQSSGEGGSTGVNLSDGESIQFAARPLLTPDEIMAELSGWRRNGTRVGFIHMRGQRPFRVDLVPYDRSVTCKERAGVWIPEGPTPP